VTDRLWAPWRMAYIDSAKDEPSDGGECFLCAKPHEGDDEHALILARAGMAYVVLNAYPYNPGHVLVAPFRHVGDLEALTDEELLDSSHLLQATVSVLKEAMQPDGFNAGLNLGRVAGAGVPGHVHWHVVPRWNGDTNFMAVVGEVRVLPESLEQTYAKLKPRFQVIKDVSSAE
jgi:ATP adenylyltransferase